MVQYEQIPLEEKESKTKGDGDCSAEATATLVRHTSQLAKENLCREDSAIAVTRDHEVSQIILKRNLSLAGGSSLVIGAIIGSGLFMLPDFIYMETGGSPLMSLTVWFVGGIVAFFGSICYAELATSINVSGGEQAYLTKMYCPLVGFLFVWTNTLILNPGGLAAISLYCSEYIVVNIQNGYSKNGTELSKDLANQSPYIKGAFAILIVGVASLINALSAELGDKMNQLFAVVKVGAIGVICSIGAYWLVKGEWSQFDTPYVAPNSTFNGAINGLMLSMWAYGGWSFLSWVTEEIINPDRNIPLSLFIGITVVCAVYILFNFAIFCGPIIVHEIGDSPFILLYAKTAWGGWGWFFASFCILTATYGAVSSNTISTTRFYHACARDGHLPRALSLCLPSRSTPIVAIIFNFVCTSIYIIAGKHASDVVDTVMYAQWVYFVLVFVGLLILRYKRPNMRRPFRAPLIIPIIQTILSLVMVLSPFFEKSVDSDDYFPNLAMKYGAVVGSIITGIPFYLLCIYKRTRLGIFDKLSGDLAKGCKHLGFQ
ncbi:b(0,+)-type amino acid transporter 1-like isoform X1 [Bolinopsis microptera]|uniref:b(0,+)-type amino acid transporter 1-like isoform X1 n=1 Tax=Bolinopsis microptera TaxID=2820187 RepID=UPI003079018D